VLIDSHCHLTDERFAKDRNQVLQNAASAGVAGIVTIASDAADSQAVAALVRDAAGESRPAPFLRGSVGIHPHEAGAAGRGDLGRIRDLAAEPGIVAIGETGLDFHYDNSPRDVQRQRFVAQLELAHELGLPAVVHSRSADADTVTILKDLPSGLIGVLHCFTGGPDLLEAGLDAGWYVSFSGIASFEKFDGIEQVRRVPADRLLVETDAPYLAPVPYRGKRNEPAYVAQVTEAVAHHRGESPEDVARYTARNAMTFYGVDEAGEGA